jgi:hypothetical protein
VNVAPILLLLALAAPETRPVTPAPAERAPEAGEPGYWEKAPPGTPEDVALWTALRDSQSGTMLQVGRIGQSTFRIRYARYFESLDEAARTAAPAKAEEARRLRSRIEIAAKQADDGIPKKGLRVHPCKYALLHLDQRMRFPDDAVMAADLPRVRTEARSCVDDLAPLAARLGPLADSLEKALAEADAFLEREELVPAPASAQPPPAKTPGAQTTPAGATPPGAKDGARP